LLILEVGFDADIQFEKEKTIGNLAILRDITTTFNVWNIDERISKRNYKCTREKIKIYHRGVPKSQYLKPS
jgi:hypothetical protein